MLIKLQSARHTSQSLLTIIVRNDPKAVFIRVKEIRSPTETRLTL